MNRAVLKIEQDIISQKIGNKSRRIYPNRLNKQFNLKFHVLLRSTDTWRRVKVMKCCYNNNNKDENISQTANNDNSLCQKFSQKVKYFVSHNSNTSINFVSSWFTKRLLSLITIFFLLSRDNCSWFLFEWLISSSNSVLILCGFTD